MWPQKILKILVPRTPPDPPLPPLTPPRGPGGPKMAKMHSLKSIDDNLCQKSHFWGVKKIDLFFHSECTSFDLVGLIWYFTLRVNSLSPALTAVTSRWQLNLNSISMSTSLRYLIPSAKVNSLNLQQVCQSVSQSVSH